MTERSYFHLSSYTNARSAKRFKNARKFLIYKNSSGAIALANRSCISIYRVHIEKSHRPRRKRIKYRPVLPTFSIGIGADHR
jgi:hypothetical protein